MAAREKFIDTLAQTRDTDCGRDLELTLPHDLPTSNGLTTGLFHHREDPSALEIILPDRTIHLLPFGPRDTAAAFEQDHETFVVHPTSFTDSEVNRLLTEYSGRYCHLLDSPAWLFEDHGQDLWISWHARERFAERVQPMADAARPIRRAYEHGDPVDVRSNHGRYHPEIDVVVCYTFDDRGNGEVPVITTIGRLDDFSEVEYGE